MKAVLSNHRQSVRKTKLVADLVRGKRVLDAKRVLMFTDKKAAGVFEKLLDSAIANARGAGHSAENLFIKEVKVDKGVEMRRYMPRSRGRATQYRRGASHLKIVLGTVTTSVKKAAKKATKKTAKKTA